MGRLELEPREGLEEQRVKRRPNPDQGVAVVAEPFMHEAEIALGFPKLGRARQSRGYIEGDKVVAPLERGAGRAPADRRQEAQPQQPQDRLDHTIGH